MEKKNELKDSWGYEKIFFFCEVMGKDPMPSDFDLACDNATCPRTFLAPLFVSCTAKRYRKAHFFFNAFPDNYIWKCPEPSTVSGTWKAHNKYLVCEHTEVLYMLSVTRLTLKKKLVEKGGKTKPQDSRLLVCSKSCCLWLTEWVELSAVISPAARGRLSSNLFFKKKYLSPND